MDIKNMKEIDEMLDQLIEEKKKLHNGKGLLRLSGLLCKNGKEMAELLHISPQQYSKLTKKQEWTKDQKQNLVDSLNIPAEVFDYLSVDTDHLGLIISHNTQGDGGIIGQNNFYNTFHLGNSEKTEDILDQMALTTKNLAQLLGKLIEKENDKNNPNKANKSKKDNK